MASTQGDSGWDRDDLRRHIQAMDDIQFVHLVADLWDRQGWEATVDQQSNDAGIDVRAEQTSPYRRTALIVAKRNSDTNPVRSPAIQQYSALKQQEPDVDEIIVVTTGRFTNSAQDRAQELNVKTINGEELCDLIDDYEAYDLVESYIGPPANSDQTSEQSPKQSQDSEPTINVEDYIDRELDDLLREEERLSMRAKERSNGHVRLNPHDATLLGIFDGLPDEITESRFRETKRERALLKTDLHITEQGDLFVEDVTAYISPKSIDSPADDTIIATIERGIQDVSWATEDGEKEFEEIQRKRTYQRRLDGSGQELWERFLDLFKNDEGTASIENTEGGIESTERSESKTTSPESAEEDLSADTSSQEESPSESEIDEIEHAESGETERKTPDTDEEVLKDVKHKQENQPSPESSKGDLDTTESDEAGMEASESENRIPNPTESSHKVERSPESSEEDRESSKRSKIIEIQPTIWQKLVVGATALWMFAYILLIGEYFVASALLWVVGYVALPVTMVLDSRETGISAVATKELIVYVLFSLLPFIGFLAAFAYLFRRRQNPWS